MEHQDWTTVTFRRRTAKNDTHTPNPERIRMAKLANSDCPGSKKCINSTSLQNLIRARIEMKLSQTMADNKCAFPCNTFKNIESKLVIPSDQQKRRIQQHFDIYLKTDIVE